MYKIYVNDRPLILAEKDESLQLSERAQVLENDYLGKPKHLLPYVDLMEKSQRYDAVIIRHTPALLLWQDFQLLFHLIEAAGGVVHRTDLPAQILMILRRNVWDLPKGKIDEGETPQQAALREVAEETGLVCTLEQRLTHTFHTYRLKRKRILKKTGWYRMITHSPNELKLQRTEEIESACWIEPQQALHELHPMWQNIRDVLHIEALKTSHE